MKQLKTKLTKALDLPPEVLLDAPIISMQSNKAFSCDNHLGLLEYSDSAIKFMTADTAVSIAGRGLCIDCFDGRRIQVSGTITSIVFE